MITPEIAQVIHDAIEDRLIDLHTMLPAKVQRYDKVKHVVELELQLKRIIPHVDGGLMTEELPVLPNVPVFTLRSGGKLLSLPIKVGTVGMVVFCEASMDQWRNLNDVASPGEVGRHTLTSGVFIPGLSSNLEPLTELLLDTDAIFGNEAGVQLRSKASTMEVTTAGAATAADFVALAAKVDENFERIASVFAAWTPVAQDGGAALKTKWTAEFLPAPAGGGPQQPTASTNLKAD